MLAGSFTHVFEALFVDAKHQVDRCQEDHGQLAGEHASGRPAPRSEGPRHDTDWVVEVPVA